MPDEHASYAEMKSHSDGIRTPANDLALASSGMSPADADDAAARRVQREESGTVGRAARSELSSILDGLATYSARERPNVGHVNGHAARHRETATGAFMLSFGWRRGLFGLWIAASFVWLASAGVYFQEEIRWDVSTLVSAESRLDTDPVHLTQSNAPGPGSGERIYQLERIYQFEPDFAARDAAQVNLIHAASVLFLPSVLVFALGWAGLWTWRGMGS